MAGGLVQDYSKSPIRSPNVAQSSFQSDEVSDATPTSQYAPPPRLGLQYPPHTQRTDITQAPVQAPINTYSSSGAPAPYYNTPYSQNTIQPKPSGGYVQNAIHDGGSTEYSTQDGESSMEYAEKTWKSASQAVSDYTVTAGEVASNTLNNIKGWLNPESKGLH